MAEAATISLVVGLGNPGARFQHTWHNLGFMVLDHWANRHNLSFKPGRGDYYRLACTVADRKIVALKPTSYMNLSGVPVANVARYLKISPENVLVICDDVALPFGTLRIRRSGSDAGHKGLASIIQHLGSDRVARMRLGIWTGAWRGELADYVLSRIPEALQENLCDLIAAAAQALDLSLKNGLSKAMNRFNGNILDDPNESDLSTNSG